MGNVRIHKTDKIIKPVNEKKIDSVCIFLYSPQLNKIEHTFGTLKKNFFQSLNAKEFKHIIIEEI